VVDAQIVGEFLIHPAGRIDKGTTMGGVYRRSYSGGKHMIPRILLGVLAASSLCLAQQADSATSPNRQGGLTLSNVLQSHLPGAARDIKSGLNLFFALDEGEGMEGVYDHPFVRSVADTLGGKLPKPYTTFDRLWQQHMVLYITENMTYKDRLRLLLSVECDLDFSMIQRIEFPETMKPKFSVYPNDIELRYTFGNLDRPWLQIAAGYFPFKYNPDAKNLGEFMLRGSAYPTTIITSPFFPLTRELGLHINGLVGNPAIDQFKWDLLVTSETNTWPVQDGTITAVISNILFNSLDIGAGVSFQRLFPVDETKTTVKDTRTVFLKDQADSGYYTFQAIKLMARASVNPLHFVPEFKIPPSFIFGKNPFFGKEDLKIYGEAAVLGYRDYIAYDSFALKGTLNPNTGDTVYSNIPGTGKQAPDSINYYNNIKDRTPLMVGINLPTNPLVSYGILPFILTKWLKDETGSDLTPLPWITLVPALLSGVAQQYLGWELGPDVLSLEFEWFSQRFTNSNRRAINPDDQIPIPYVNTDRNLSAFGKPEPYKYSLYFKKSFMNRFALSALVGRDHMRPLIFANPAINQTDDFLQAKQHWYWMVRLSANF
jgi:hypothetical protein